MLQRRGRRSRRVFSFDLAPTGALCYSRRHDTMWPRCVLISLPQERCATFVRVKVGHKVRFDLAPTGALCYTSMSLTTIFKAVLISLPQERCATEDGAPLADELLF